LIEEQKADDIEAEDMDEAELLKRAKELSLMDSEQKKKKE